ncbi:MAG: hypothetical protein LBQ42_14050 [Synergistaceae bacterium]|jgi:hypothetical protein|nr:hypothetical protein [Synergistaceae bacterium]
MPNTIKDLSNAGHLAELDETFKEDDCLDREIAEFHNAGRPLSMEEKERLWRKYAGV